MSWMASWTNEEGGKTFTTRVSQSKRADFNRRIQSDFYVEYEAFKP